MTWLIVVEKYGHNDGIPAMFQILYFIGWKPDKTQVTEIPVEFCFDLTVLYNRSINQHLMCVKVWACSKAIIVTAVGKKNSS